MAPPHTSALARKCARISTMDHASGAGAARSLLFGTPAVAAAMRRGAAASRTMISNRLRCGSRALRERGPPAGVTGPLRFDTTRSIPHTAPGQQPPHPRPAPAAAFSCHKSPLSVEAALKISTAHTPQQRCLILQPPARTNSRNQAAPTPACLPAAPPPPFASQPAVHYN